MKDSDYIQLLNLYLDHEISAADAARLEAEVQTNPARRRIYQQYCRMQKACKMAAADFQTDTEAAVAVAEKKVVAFDPTVISTAAARRKQVGGRYTVGTFAALAACVAIIFVGRNRQETSDGLAAPAPAIAQTPAVAESVEMKPNVGAADTPTPRGLVSVAPRTQATWIANSPLLTGNTQAGVGFAAAAQQGNKPLDWIDLVHLAPLPQRVLADDLHFAETLRSEGRPLGNRASSPTKQPQPGDEMVTFQFVK